MLTNFFRGVRDAAGPASGDIVHLYKLSDWPKLGPRQRASAAALVIRCAIDCGSARQLQYE